MDKNIGDEDCDEEGIVRTYGTIYTRWPGLNVPLARTTSRHHGVVIEIRQVEGSLFNRLYSAIGKPYLSVTSNVSRRM